MIDPCIYKVYKENQQVFIPEFGAVIHSETSDSPDFNDMLNFDDGKVIEAIVEKHQMSEDEAKIALEEHVQMMKAKLDEGKTHYIRGLGHIYKDETGSFAISKKKPSLDFSSSSANESEETAEQVETLTSENNELDDFSSMIESSEIENLEASSEFSSVDDQSEQDSDFSSFMSTSEDEFENEFGSTEDEKFETSSDLASDDFNEESADTSWQDDDSEYNYDEENFEDSEDGYEGESFYSEEGKGNRLLKTLTAAVIVLFVVSAVVYYFLFYDGGDNKADQSASYKTELAAAKGSKSATSKDKKETTESSKKVTAAPASSTGAKSNATPSRTVSSNQYVTGQGPFYSVILGSFKVENNANNFQKYLQDRGMEVAIFRRDNDFHFVGFEEIPGKSNAVGLLTEMREEEPTAWIIRKKGQ